MPSPPLHKFFDYIHCFIHFPRVRTHLLGAALSRRQNRSFFGSSGKSVGDWHPEGCD